MDYHDIAMSIANSIGKGSKPLSNDQRIMLAGAIAPWLSERDERIRKLRHFADWTLNVSGDDLLMTRAAKEVLSMTEAP